MTSVEVKTVAITGANGNLGRKLLSAFLNAPGPEIIAIDRAFDGFPVSDPRVKPVLGDLSDAADRRWVEAVAAADAVVHLAAQNPYPDASWTDSGASFEMTARVARVAAAGRVGRFVFASSNHVMGGYKDSDIADRPGALTVDLPPRPGTRNQSADGLIDSTAYATAKFMGEHLLAVTAAAGGFTAVSLRIGWCQPGVNDPATISAAGTIKSDAAADTDAGDPDYRWFRGMWLSNQDFIGFVSAALTADAAGWPAPAIIVNAMSANRGMAWDIESGVELIGYRPRD